VLAIAYAHLESSLPALTRQSQARPELGEALGASRLAAWFPGARRQALLCLAGGLLQVTDFWDASHTAAQEADDLGERDLASYWHAIAHRREPDPGNATYWFRRVGKHRVLSRLAASAEDGVSLEDRPAWWGRVVNGSEFDAMAFIDVCGRVRSGAREEAVARGLQRVEMALLLGESLASVLR
jgi:hypothetical protein